MTATNITNLPTTTPAHRSTSPSPMTVEEGRWFDARLGRLVRQGSPVWALDERYALTRDERGWLAERRAVLADALAPAPADTIRTAVARFFLRWPNIGRDDAESRRRTYEREISKFPLWAIIEGMQAMGGEFAPASPVLAAACAAALVGPHTEMTRIDRLLNAPTFREPDEAERKRVAERFQRVVDDLKLRQPPDDLSPSQPREKHRLTQADYERVVEDMAANPETLPPLSDALRATLRRDG